MLAFVESCDSVSLPPEEVFCCNLYSDKPLILIEYIVDEPVYTGSRYSYILKSTSFIVSGLPSENLMLFFKTNV